MQSAPFTRKQALFAYDKLAVSVKKFVYLPIVH